MMVLLKLLFSLIQNIQFNSLFTEPRRSISHVFERQIRLAISKCCGFGNMWKKDSTNVGYMVSPYCFWVVERV